MAASCHPKRKKRDPSAAQTCLFPHQANDMSSLGFSNFSRSLNPKPLLAPFESQRPRTAGPTSKRPSICIQIQHGLGKVLESYKEAVNALMERNIPDVLHDKQTKVIFLPETHLPKKPRVVDLKRFLERRKKLQKLPSLE